MTPERTAAMLVEQLTERIAQDAWKKAQQTASMHVAAAVYAHELLQAVSQAEHRAATITRAATAALALCRSLLAVREGASDELIQEVVDALEKAIG